ncbi:unnamed protein product [Closterium sp. Naga37s-1]|nr:unnamed protein product [Closterium sp. Naga37s-1]
MAGVDSWNSRSTIPTPYLPALNTEIDSPGLVGGFLSSLDSPGDSIPGLHVAPLLEEQPELIKPESSHFACDSTFFGSSAIHPDVTAFMAGAGNEISQTDLDNLAEWIPRLAGGAAAAAAGQPSSIDEIAAELQSLDAKQFLLQQQMTAHAGGGGGGSAGGEEADLYAALVQQQLAAEMPHDATNAASSAVAFHGRDLEELSALSQMAGLPNSTLGGGLDGANLIETNAARSAATEPAALSAALGIIANDPAAARNDALTIRPAAPAQFTAQFSRAASQLAAGNVFGAPPQWPSAATPQASSGIQIGANWLQNQPQQQQQQQQQQQHSQSQPQPQPPRTSIMEPASLGPAAALPVTPADELEALFQQIPPELAPEERIVLAAALMAEMQQQRSNAAAAGGMMQHPHHMQQSQQPQHSQHSRHSQMHASGGASGNNRGINFPQAPVSGHFEGDSLAMIGNQPPAFASEPHQRLAGTRQQHASGAARTRLASRSLVRRGRRQRVRAAEEGPVGAGEEAGEVVAVEGLVVLVVGTQH